MPFLEWNISISIDISLNFVPKGQINYIPALVQKMAWRRPGDKPLYKPMMLGLLTHVCVTRPQWIKQLKRKIGYDTRVWILKLNFKNPECDVSIDQLYHITEVRNLNQYLDWCGVITEIYPGSYHYACWWHSHIGHQQAHWWRGLRPVHI